jgi:3-oxoacyl-[acyl-carrier protein] reductase
VTREFEAGMTAMVVGLGLAVLAVWLRRPSLALFIAAGALIGMARTLAVGLGSDGIAVTAVAPGLTHTPASVGRAEAEFADTEAHMALAVRSGSCRAGSRGTMGRRVCQVVLIKPPSIT